MKILIAVNNTSVGAVSAAVNAAGKLFSNADIILLVKEKTKKGFREFFKTCGFLIYVEGKTINSVESIMSFLGAVKKEGFDAFWVVRDKDRARDIRLELIGLFCGFKKYCFYNAVKDTIVRQNRIFVFLKVFSGGILMLFVVSFLSLFFLILFILGLPGYIFKKEIKAALIYFKINTFNLIKYFTDGFKKASEKFTLDLLIYFEFFKDAYSGKAVFEKEKIKKILVIKIEHLGDLLLTVPLLRALRSNFPNAKISLVAGPWNKTAAEGCPYIDELLIYKTNNPVFNRGKRDPFILFWKLIFLGKLKFSGYDLCIDTGGWAETIKTAYCSGAKFKAVVDYKRINNIFNIRTAEFDEYDDEIKRSFKVLELFDVKDKLETKTEYWINSGELSAAKALLETKGVTEKDVLTGFYAGASSAPIMWELEKYAIVIDGLSGKMGLKAVIFSAPGEQMYVDNLVKLLKGPYIIMPEYLSLKEFAAVVKHCKLFVSNDGGLSHLATAMNVPTVTLYGPSNEKQWGGYNSSRTVISKNYPCSPCKKYNCIKNVCMEAIQPEEVMEAIKCALG